VTTTDPCVIGVESCGCVTVAVARPAEPLEKHWRDALAEVVANGGEVVRTTCAEAKERPNFLPSECPHDPKGWAPDA